MIPKQAPSPEGASTLLAAWLAAVALAGPLAAAPVSWDGGGGNGNWFTDANWSGDLRPSAGDAVTIAGGVSVLLTNATPPLGSLTLDASTLVFSNWLATLSAENVRIQNSGLLDLPAGFLNAGPSNRVHIVCSNFDLSSDSTINANAAGYLGTNGPGRGTGERGRGGGYGGQGGIGNYADRLGQPYGDPGNPFWCGSGGCGRTTNAGAGGGAVWIEASGTAAVHGVITARGGSGNARFYAGGGSGGGIYLSCDTLTGAGLLTAGGGNAQDLCGAGGGGRIAVAYRTAGAAWPGLRFSASPGIDSVGGRHRWKAEAGSVWLSDASILSESMAPWLVSNAVVFLGSSTGWSGASFTLGTNRFRIASTGFTLNVAGDLRVTENGDVGAPFIRCGGWVVLTNGGDLRVHAEPTNAPDAFGGLLAVSNTLFIASNSTLWVASDDTNGGSTLVRAAAVEVSQGGTISGYGYGYRATYGPGAGADAERRSGGGHGGRGGGGSYGSYSSGNGGGRTNGAPDRPLAGSGGCWRLEGGWGGALVWIEADTVRLDGQINANGGPYSRDHGSGGAGGGVLIRCSNLAGSEAGLIQADGGGGNTSTSGGGSGGRIALIYTNTAWPGIRLATSPGTGYGAPHPYRAEQGTVYLAHAGVLSNAMQGDRLTDVTLFISNTTAWAVDSLAVSNCSFRFGDQAFQVTVSNRMVIDTNGLFGAPVILCGGDLTVTNGGILDIVSGPTNTPGPNYGALVLVSNALNVGQAWIYATADDTNGGAPLFRAAAVFIAAGGGVSASSRGFRGRYGPGKGDPNERRRGGGHGGRGGIGSYGDQGNGLVYGWTNAPLESGSGGGGDASYPLAWPSLSGFGGGLIRLEAAGVVIVEGTLTANGGSGLDGYVGGGSGGSILVLAAELAGSGLLQANGGAGAASTSGGGGGGRIAVATGFREDQRVQLLNQKLFDRMRVFEASPTFSGTTQVNGGTGYTAGEPGTCRFVVMPPPDGTVIEVY